MLDCKGLFLKSHTTVDEEGNRIHPPEIRERVKALSEGEGLTFGVEYAAYRVGGFIDVTDILLYLSREANPGTGTG